MSAARNLQASEACAGGDPWSLCNGKNANCFSGETLGSVKAKCFLPLFFLNFPCFPGCMLREKLNYQEKCCLLLVTMHDCTGGTCQACSSPPIAEKVPSLYI